MSGGWWSVRTRRVSMTRGIDGLGGLSPPVGAGCRVRLTCEETYRNQKNGPHQGFRLDCVTLSTPERLDRLWLVFA